jgi:peptide/nickel transport system permease protein
MADTTGTGGRLAASRPKLPSRAAARLWASGTVVLGFIVVAIVGPMLYDFDPVTTNLSARLVAPFSSDPEGTFYLFGTDQLGRDVLGQVIFGARVTLTVAGGTVLLGLLVGAALGMISGYAGGWLDMVIMRFVDVQLTIPPIILALLMVAVLGPGVGTLIIALSITRWVVFARVARSAALVASTRPFVDAARISGLSGRQILVSHIARFTVSPLLVVATLQIGLVVLAEAAISFLGLGAPPTQPSWGSIIANGRSVLVVAWWISTIPGIALSLLVVSVAVFGDELRDRLQASPSRVQAGNVA